MQTKFDHDNTFSNPFINQIEFFALLRSLDVSKLTDFYNIDINVLWKLSAPITYIPTQG